MAMEQFNQQQLILARSAASAIETYFNEIGIVLQATAEIPAIQRMTPGCLEYMHHMYNGFLPKTSVRRLDEKGVLRFIYPFDGWRGYLVGGDYSKEAHFLKARHRNHVNISGIIINEQGDMRIRVSIPVYLTDAAGSDTRLFKGVLMVSFALDTITETFISPIKSGETGYAWLLNQDGFFVGHYENEFIGKDAFTVRTDKHPDLSYESINQIQRKMLAGGEGTGRYVSGWHRERTELVEKIVAYAPARINGITWSVAVCAPIDEVDCLIRTATLNIVSTFSFVVILLLAGGGFISISAYRWSQSLEREVNNRTIELAQTNTRFQTLIRAIPDAVHFKDAHGRHLIVNKACEKKMALEREEARKKSRTELLPQNYGGKSRQSDEEAMKGCVPFRYEEEVTGTDGKVLYFETITVPICDDQGISMGLVTVSRDITERKLLESQLSQAQKMEAVGTMVDGIAHDFNNILQAIAGYIELLLMRKGVNDPDHKYLSVMDKSTDRAIKLVRQLLLFSRKVESELRPVNLNQEIMNFNDLLEKTIHKMISIEMDLADNLNEINADSLQLERMMMNLAFNARDAMPDGGRLIFETKNVVLDDEYCKIHLGTTVGENVLFTVSDTGQGIDRKTMPHIFEPFYTTKETGKGTGLGLASVYGIVKNHGGHIMCYSEPNRGTTFKILIPVMKDENAREELRHEKAEEISGGDETILLVDDEENILDIGKEMLERHGYVTITARNGEEAIDLYKRDGSRIDLVILDIGMPGMGGQKCLRELMGIDPEVKIIIASGYSVSKTAKEILEAGTVNYIDKPYRSTDMMKMIRETLVRN